MPEAIPVIDLRDSEHGPKARAGFLNRLRAAVHDIGFFQLTGHGVTGAAELLDLTRRLFSLPESEHAALDVLNSPHFRGYSAMGRERTRASRTSAGSWTSVPSARRGAPARESPLTSGWSAPTSGRPPCRSCGRPYWHGWTG